MIADGVVALALQQIGHLDASGALAESRSRDAILRGDLYGQALFRQHSAYASVALGELETARTQARWITTDWSRGSYTVPGFYAMVIEAMADLYEGEPGEAARRLIDDRAPFRKAGGHRIPMSRIDANVLEARISLCLADDAPERAQLVPVARLTASLGKETRADGSAWAALLNAGVLFQSGDADAAGDLFREAAERFTLADMEMWACCARMRAAELSHDRPTWEEGATWLRSHGVAAPERWLAISAPLGPLEGETPGTP